MYIKMYHEKRNNNLRVCLTLPGAGSISEIKVLISSSTTEKDRLEVTLTSDIT